MSWPAELLDLDPRPTALAAFNDKTAIGALHVELATELIVRGTTGPRVSTIRS